MTERSLVCDTTVLLDLDRIGALDLLAALFDQVSVPTQVILELDMGRLLWADTVDPRELAWAEQVVVSQADMVKLPANRLGPGE